MTLFRMVVMQVLYVFRLSPSILSFVHACLQWLVVLSIVCQGYDSGLPFQLTDVLDSTLWAPNHTRRGQTISRHTQRCINRSDVRPIAPGMPNRYHG